MKINRYHKKAVSMLSVLILASVLLAACAAGSVDESPVLYDGLITICHASGDAASPYDEVTIDFNELAGHGDHPDDIIPASAGGCPTEAETGNNDGTITICHASGDATSPYDEITVDFTELVGHTPHVDDIIPAPAGGCPTVPVTDDTVGGKITICHATGSEKNPYVEITISVNGLGGHSTHEGDIIPASAGGCPASNDAGKGKGSKKP